MTFLRRKGISATGLLSGILIGTMLSLPLPARASGMSELPDLAGNTPADRAQFLEKTRRVATAIVIGHGSRTIWVYFNPDCSYCHRLWEALSGVSDLTVLWIPVAFSLKPSSLARSAAILAAKDPPAALADNENHFSDLLEEGGYPVSGPIDTKAQEAVTQNTMMLKLWTGKIATPTILYRDTRGRVQESVGLPADIPAMLETIAPAP